MSEPRLTGTRDDNRTAMARISDNRPFKSYVWRDGEAEPAAVVAARERHRRLNDEIARANAALCAEEIMPDTGPGLEWYRELDDQDAGTP